MGIERVNRAVALVTTLIIAAGCSGSPRFAGPGSPAETAPEVVRAPSPGDSASQRAGAAHAPGTSASPADSLGNAVVKRAADYLGTPYRIGGTTSKGIDCSGLTFTVYRAFGVRLPRASRDQARVGEPIPRDALTVGDLVFFGNGSSSISHVGIYAGDGEFIHASTRARSVRFDRLDNKYFHNRYVTARRVL